MRSEMNVPTAFVVVRLLVTFCLGAAVSIAVGKTLAIAVCQQFDDMRGAYINLKARNPESSKA